mmetsp:Transcript_3785/g.14806  ORF Transcript_3785/g.14806 Transcript_3785/m.14806 type:complete len:126 (-) Transcript_3785:118-495(-)
MVGTSGGLALIFVPKMKAIQDGVDASSVIYSSTTVVPTSLGLGSKGATSWNAVGQTTASLGGRRRAATGGSATGRISSGAIRAPSKPNAGQQEAVVSSTSPGAGEGGMREPLKVAWDGSGGAAAA